MKPECRRLAVASPPWRVEIRMTRQNELNRHDAAFDRLRPRNAPRRGGRSRLGLRTVSDRQSVTPPRSPPPRPQSRDPGIRIGVEVSGAARYGRCTLSNGTCSRPLAGKGSTYAARRLIGARRRPGDGVDATPLASGLTEADERRLRADLGSTGYAALSRIGSAEAWLELGNVKGARNGLPRGII